REGLFPWRFKPARQESSGRRAADGAGQQGKGQEGTGRRREVSRSSQVSSLPGALSRIRRAPRPTERAGAVDRAESCRLDLWISAGEEGLQVAGAGRQRRRGERASHGRNVSVTSQDTARACFPTDGVSDPSFLVHRAAPGQRIVGGAAGATQGDLDRLD